MQPFLPPPTELLVQACLANFASNSTVDRVLGPTTLGSTDASSVDNRTPQPPAYISKSASLDSTPVASFPSPAHGTLSPIHVSRLISLLDGYPTDVASFLVSGVSQGFDIGFQYESPTAPMRDNKFALKRRGSVGGYT